MVLLVIMFLILSFLITPVYYSLSLGFFSLKLDRNRTLIAIAIITIIFLAGSFLVADALVNKWQLISASKHSIINMLWLVLTSMFLFWYLGIVVLAVGHPLIVPTIGKYAVKLVHDYESEKGLKPSNFNVEVPQFEGVTRCLDMGKEACLIVLLEDYDIFLLQVLQEKNIQVYIVYDLEKKPKLLKFRPSIVKKYSKNYEEVRGPSPVNKNTMIFNAKKAVEGEKMKPIMLTPIFEKKGSQKRY